MRKYTYVIMHEKTDHYYGKGLYESRKEAYADAKKLCETKKRTMWVINYDEDCDVAMYVPEKKSKKS